LGHCELTSKGEKRAAIESFDDALLTVVAELDVLVAEVRNPITSTRQAKATEAAAESQSGSKSGVDAGDNRARPRVASIVAVIAAAES
jgi:hypothetical protein